MSDRASAEATCGMPKTGFKRIPAAGGVMEVAGRRLAVVARAEWHASDQMPRPDVSFVPPLERRRLTAVERAVFAVAHAVGSVADGLPVVFASRWGEIGTTLKLMRQFREEAEMSPAGFSSSVHNAAPGAWSLFAHDHAPYTAISAGADSFEMGLEEVAAQAGRVLFVCAEEETPELYRVAIPEPQAACALAAVLEPHQTDGFENLTRRGKNML